MSILGVCDGHDSGAALVDADGRLMFAVSEERLTRTKRQPGFPAGAVRACLERADRIDEVAVAERAGRLGFRALDPIYRRLQPDVDPTSLRSRLMVAWSIRAARSLPHLEPAASLALLRLRLRRLGIQAPVRLYDHHRCHARGAAAGRDDALVLTLDALGDGLFGAAFRSGSNGDLRRIERFEAPGGPALLFGQVTALLGYGEGEEGKVVARAGAGTSAACRELFERALRWDGRRFGRPLSPGRLVRELRRHDPDDVAAGLQARVEEVVCGLVRDLLRRHGGRRLALAGGLFANVALNREVAAVARAEGLDEVFVFPAMGDSGLCAGAAFEALVRRGGVPRAIDSARLGPLPGALPTPPSDLAVVRGDGEQAIAAVSQALRDGALVATCRGRLEFGPRALGARSLLLLAGDPERALALDHALGRDPVMPFGPLMTAEAAPGLLRDLDAATATMCRYMTVALPATERMRSCAPAAVHVDGTARAQILDRPEDPALHEVLRLLPDGVCINTSLNLHHEPIVHTAHEAARCALRAGASLLWLHDRSEP